MPRGSVGETVGGMFNDLKSRLGFDRGDDDYGDRDDYGYDDRDDYDDYSGNGEYSEYDDGYDDNTAVGGYRPLGSQSSRSSRYAKNDISSSLVSIDDVKATTPIPDLYDSDPVSYAPDRAEYSSSQSSLPTYVPMPSATAGMGTTLDSSPGTTGYADSPAAPVYGGVSASEGTASAGAGSYDPYEAYSNANPAAHMPVRSLTVVKPTSYGDVERVARAVKSGDVVVLAMRYTPDDLSKRILDFSFGVASALDANVECPGDKVFAIARGNALTDEEKRRLGAQGVL